MGFLSSGHHTHGARGCWNLPRSVLSADAGRTRKASHSGCGINRQGQLELTLDTDLSHTRCGRRVLLVDENEMSSILGMWATLRSGTAVHTDLHNPVWQSARFQPLRHAQVDIT